MRAFLAVLLASSFLLAIPPRADFPPFVMTIEEWNARVLGLADGTTYPGGWTRTLDYHDRQHWTVTIVATSGAARGTGSTYRCEAGRYSAYDAVKSYTATRDEPRCPSVDRWIGYGIATAVRWARHDGPKPGQLTYEDTGERVVFDLATGLPVRYEAGRSAGAGPLETRDYVLVRYGP